MCILSVTVSLPFQSLVWSGLAWLACKQLPVTVHVNDMYHHMSLQLPTLLYMHASYMHVQDVYSSRCCKNLGIELELLERKCTMYKLITAVVLHVPACINFVVCVCQLEPY